MDQYNFDAIGTRWQIDIYQELSGAKKAELFSRLRARIEIFEKTYSRFRADSLVTRMSKETGTFSLPPDSQRLFAVYRDVYERTKGLVTPLVGGMLSDAGYDAQYSLQQKKELDAAPSWDDVMDYAPLTLIIKKPVLLDFGAGGKGYLIDLVAEVLEAEGVSAYCIDAGGDILQKNTEPIRIGLENPKNIQQVIGVYPLHNKSICGSAGNRRAWGKFNHVMNPKTGTSVSDILAVWVIADSAFIADILATCLFFIPAKKILNAYAFEYVLIRADFSVEKSAQFSGELFTS